jgi:hypothetical protein
MSASTQTWQLTLLTTYRQTWIYPESGFACIVTRFTLISASGRSPGPVGVCKNIDNHSSWFSTQAG